MNAEKLLEITQSLRWCHNQETCRKILCQQGIIKGFTESALSLLDKGRIGMAFTILPDIGKGWIGMALCAYNKEAGEPRYAIMAIPPKYRNEAHEYLTFAINELISGEKEKLSFVQGGKDWEDKPNKDITAEVKGMAGLSENPSNN